MLDNKQNPLAKANKMAQLIAAKDWSETPVGAIDTWPVGLRSTLGILLHSKFPMFLFWGNELTCFYNDACSNGFDIDGKHSGILGKSGAGMLQQAWHVILPVIKKLMDSGEASWHEDQWLPVLRNGKMEDTYWTSSYSPVNDELGIFEGVLITLNDVTDKVEAHKKMEVAEERARLAIEITQIATWDLDLQTHQMIHSESLAVIFGHPKTVCLTETEIMAQIEPEDLVNIVEKAFESAMNTSIYKYEARIVKRNGQPGWIRSHGKIFFDAHNEPLRILGTLIDITEERNHREMMTASELQHRTFNELLEKQVASRTFELEQNNINLVKINIELQSFVYVSSHDLQEPLRKIQMFISRLLETEEANFTENAKECLRRINAASVRMRNLIEDLLAYSRTNAADKVLVLSDLQALAEEVVEDYSDIIRDTHALITVSGLCEVKVIPFQFKQLLNNLIGNALKFTRPDTTARIAIKAKQVEGITIKNLGANPALRYCRISISDNGIGFNMQYKKKIFEVFQRLHHKQEYSGTGIGLAIVKKIIENHNGFIVAKSKPNQGAVFNIYIPDL